MSWGSQTWHEVVFWLVCIVRRLVWAELLAVYRLEVRRAKSLSWESLLERLEMGDGSEPSRVPNSSVLPYWPAMVQKKIFGRKHPNIAQVRFKVLALLPKLGLNVWIASWSRLRSMEFEAWHVCLPLAVAACELVWDTSHSPSIRIVSTPKPKSANSLSKPESRTWKILRKPGSPYWGISCLGMCTGSGFASGEFPFEIWVRTEILSKLG